MITKAIGIVRASSTIGLVLTVGCTIFLFGAVVNAQPAQQSTPAPAAASDTDVAGIKDVRSLLAERETLTAELRELDQTVDDLQKQINSLKPADMLQNDVTQANTVLDKLNKRASTPPTETQQEQIDKQERYLATLTANLNAITTSKPLLATTRSERDKKRSRLLAIEQRIAQLFDATHDQNVFRLYATISFGVLVLIVVGGFYLIAWYKEGVAATIFAGELGMQFVTLFLIVIAIILFGIMGTLEGKELSALLGGISGYILGKAGTKPTAKAPPDSNQPPPNDLHLEETSA